MQTGSNDQKSSIMIRYAKESYPDVANLLRKIHPKIQVGYKSDALRIKQKIDSS